MGNFCSSNADCITLKEWFEIIKDPSITTEISNWVPDRSCHKDDIGKQRYYLYHIKKGEYNHPDEAGHVTHTSRLKVNLVKRFSDLCSGKLSGSHISDPMAEYASLIICMRTSVDGIVKLENVSDGSILKSILGFALAYVTKVEDITSNINHEMLPEETNVLYVDSVCSNCRQGTQIMKGLEILTPELQISLFGSTYNTICVLSLDSSKTFYDKLGYKVVNSQNNLHFMYKKLNFNTLQTGGKAYKIYKGKKYVVRKGSRGGSYILVNGIKVYIHKY